MPIFKVISLEEALEATKITRWLEEEFGLELGEFTDLVENPGTRRKYERIRCLADLR